MTNDLVHGLLEVGDEALWIWSHVDCVYDSASGQLLSGSFMDYCMPRADNLPKMTVSTHSTPSAHTPLGVKGCGEVGTIGSPAAVTNAVVDALSPYGVRHIDMPATPNRIWRHIHNGAAK